jgi:hypothetical protein
MVSHFALAGIVLLVVIRLRRPELLEGLPERPLAVLPGAAVGLVGLFLLMQPIAVVVHRATLTPERTLVFGAATLGLLPLTLAFNLLLRRGATGSATLTALAGRVLVLLVLLAGVKAGVLDVVLLFMLPTLAAVYLLFEVLASALYAASRNLLAIALLRHSGLRAPKPGTRLRSHPWAPSDGMGRCRETPKTREAAAFYPAPLPPMPSRAFPGCSTSCASRCARATTASERRTHTRDGRAASSSSTTSGIPPTWVPRRSWRFSRTSLSAVG